MMKLVQIKPLDGYRLWLRFADGVEGQVDLSNLAGRGVFEAWKDRDFFESVRVDDSGAAVWGDKLDLCPDALYLRLTGKNPEDIFPKLKNFEAHA